MRIKVFRWKAIGPLLLFLAILAVLVWLFAEPVARDTTEEVSTELLGTQVDVGRLDICRGRRRSSSARSRSPIRSTACGTWSRPTGSGSSSTRRRWPRRSWWSSGSPAGDALRHRPEDAGAARAREAASPRRRCASVRQWARQFDVPLLQLTPIDTIRQLVLDPTQLGTVQAAEALVARTDSTRQALEQGFQALDIRGTVDSARALADRLDATDPQHARPRRHPAGDRSTVQAHAQAGRRGEAAARTASQRNVTQRRGAARDRACSELDEARQQDYAFARSLLKLPTFSGARDRQRVLRQGERGPLPAGAVLGRAGAALHAARPPAA